MGHQGKFALSLLALLTIACASPLDNSEQSGMMDLGMEVTEFMTDAIEAIEPSNPNAFADLLSGSMMDMETPSTNILRNDLMLDDNTVGLVIEIERFLHPLSEIFWLFIDSLLRNTNGKTLPCTITSWIPLRGTCTPVAKS